MNTLKNKSVCTLIIRYTFSSNHNIHKSLGSRPFNLFTFESLHVDHPVVVPLFDSMQNL